MKKILATLFLIALLCACVSDAWLDLVGVWEDIESPILQIEFRGNGTFKEYFYGELVGWGEFQASGNDILLVYESECGNNGIDCSVRLGFNVVGDTLIITDSEGEIRFQKGQLT